MASLLDFLSLLVTAAFFVGIIIVVVYVVRQIHLAVNKAKTTLQQKGLHITDSGLSVKTDRHFDRDDYVDATQRGLLKAMSAASFGKVDEHGHHLPTTPSPSISRHSSAGSHSGVSTHDERKSRFGSRKGNGGGK
ncbi:hypothetical protein PILCRDRAFT_830112 [Piloderma croceum F 1598]|uniref:Uncharacterized protein n=1 Tax=Piloderma croceum (strain F 1598) TaxID=765440 RepID=A0A0C3B3E1_PILCF|nr:hypothetical protein PILCRDRAFT_830112 [Piloderma croceum F 1598]